MFSRRVIPCLAAVWAISACASEPTAPTVVDPAQDVAFAGSCQANPAQIESLIRTVFSNGGPNVNSALSKWKNVTKQVDKKGNKLPQAQKHALNLIDFILKKRAQGQVITDDATLTNLVNQILCFVGLGGIEDPDDTWVVNPGDPVQTFVTVDEQSGIQFPSDAVSELTLVTAVRSNPAALVTNLDKYPFVYDWKLVPAQTLQNGAVATVGICPDPASFADVPASELQDLLDRLVLGHQRSATAFEVLERVPVPAAMTLQCADIPDQPSASRGLFRDLTDRVVDWILPQPVMAAAVRLPTGGVGGSTSEFSPLGPVDPKLRGGGVGGSTSEFTRMDVASAGMAPGAYAGTVGTQRTSGLLPTITITTRRGTVIPGVGVTWTAEPPATQTPAGNASVCGANTVTNAQGVASVTCLDFGTTVNLAVAYTKVRATFTAPAGLEAAGATVITFEPPFQTWLAESYGATDLVFTSPPAGRTFAAGNPYQSGESIPVRIEIRSSLGDIVPIASNSVNISLRTSGGGSASFAPGSVTTRNATAGVVDFLVAANPGPGNTFVIEGRASLAGGVVERASNVFSVDGSGGPASSAVRP